MGATKGKSHKTYSRELKLEILARLANNTQSNKSIAREYGISIKTIEGWVTKQRKGIDIITDSRGKKKTTDNNVTIEELQQQIDILKKMGKFLKDQQEKK